jgi:hypothetical protein
MAQAGVVGGGASSGRFRVEAVQGCGEPVIRPDPCAMCLGMNPAICCSLQRLLPPGCSRFIAQTQHFAAVPTFGCFVAGYLASRMPRARLAAAIADPPTAC